MGTKGHWSSPLKGITYYLLQFWLKLFFNLVLHRIRPSPHALSLFLYDSEPIKRTSDLLQTTTGTAHRSHLWLTPHSLLCPKNEWFWSRGCLSLPPPLATCDLFSHFHMSCAASPTGPVSYPLVQLLPLCMLLIIPLSLYWHLLQYPLFVRKQHNVGVQVPPLWFTCVIYSH
jgi:hypothetical protein